MKRRATAANALNQHELEILKGLATGLSDQQIADELVLSVNTIKWYNRQIYSKLGVISRTQAIARASNLIVAASEGSMPPPDSSTTSSRYRLPAQSSLFVGRSREIAEAKRLLSGSRLLTLTGVGGTGKTQLALRIAADVVPAFADGACFVDLAPLADHTQVAKAIAGALGVLERPGEALVDTLKRALAQQELLLLIDNFEQVIMAAPVVSELLAGATQLKVLVTSRESLRIAGEQEYQVPSLSLPAAEEASPHDLTASEAGLFFVRRAQMVQPHFELNEMTAPVIAQICRRLDGLPLAVELAAARCKVFSPQIMLEQLAGTRKGSPLRALAGGSRDTPQRQRTLRDSIAWSYNLLDLDEKLLFARLAVFRGGSSLEAIEGVCGSDLSVDSLDVLASLVEKNLVQQRVESTGELRFVMLEMIHEYARECLNTSGEADPTRRRHAEYFVELAEQVEPEFRRAGYEHWSRKFVSDLDNLHAVLEWSLDDGDVTLGVRLAGAISWFWFINGYHVEGQRWTQRLLDRLDEAPRVYHPMLLMSAGLMVGLHDLDAGRLLFIRARDTARDMGNQIELAWALGGLGYTMLREPQAAMPLAEESLAMFRHLGNQPGMVQVLNIIGNIAWWNGNYERAKHVYEECIAISQQTGERRRIVLILVDLAYIAMHEGDLERARELGRQGLLLAHEMDAQLLMAMTLTTLAKAIGMSGQSRQAIRWFGAAETALERMGALLQLHDKSAMDAMFTAARTQLGKATFQLTYAEGRALALEQAVAEALDECNATSSITLMPFQRATGV